MKIIVTIIPTRLVTNSLLFLFCSFVETKNNNQLSSKLVVWYRETFLFLFMVSRALLQRYAEFNRLLWKDFLTCYSCSYYSCMLRVDKILLRVSSPSWPHSDSMCSSCLVKPFIVFVFFSNLFSSVTRSTRILPYL